MTQLNDVAISTIEWKIQFNSPFERLVIGDTQIHTQNSPVRDV